MSAAMAKPSPAIEAHGCAREVRERCALGWSCATARLFAEWLDRIGAGAWLMAIATMSPPSGWSTVRVQGRSGGYHVQVGAGKYRCVDDLGRLCRSTIYHGPGCRHYWAAVEALGLEPALPELSKDDPFRRVGE